MVEKMEKTSNIRIGAGLVTWAALSDRFAIYRKASNIEDAIRQAASIPGVQGIDISRNYLPEDIQSIKTLLNDLNCEVASVGAGLSSGTLMAQGSFSSIDPEVRRIAKNRVVEAMDIASELGTDKVLMWFGQDGYDYHFETDYESIWGRLVEGIRECARFRKDIRLCLEYKAREPKSHQIINNASTALVLLNEVGEDNVGVLFDVGHALLADETLAVSAALLARYNKLWHVHLNDNYFHSDSDLIPGTVHTMAFLELFFWLNRLAYDGYVSFDTVAHSLDPIGVTAESIRFTKALIAAANRINYVEMEQVFASRDALTGLSLARKALFNQ